MSNTHRAVIESSFPPKLNLIARGPKDFCEGTLAQWIKEHPLGEFETGMVLAVEQPKAREVDPAEELIVYGYCVVDRAGDFISPFEKQQDAIDYAAGQNKDCQDAGIDWDYKVAAIVDQGGL